MPKLSVWMIRMAMIYLGIGVLFGAFILHHKGIPLYGWTWKLLNPHIELMIFGWTMQFVMGMAFWILPRFGSELGHDFRYGKRVYLGWWSFAFLNAGIIITSLAGWFALASGLLAGRMLSLSAVVLFAMLIWPRIKPIAEYAVSQNSVT